MDEKLRLFFQESFQLDFFFLNINVMLVNAASEELSLQKK